jgi:hypothetical protein
MNFTTGSSSVSINSSVKIYVVGFDRFGAPPSDIFVPIQAGKAISLNQFEVLGDNTGDNISELNPIYAEMTAMYWVWKNAIKSDYVGFFHYRRYLDFSGKPPVKNSDFSFANFDPLTMRRYGWSDDNIRSAVAKHDITAPPLDKIGNPQDNYKTSCSIYEQYLCYHVGRDIDLMIEEAKKRSDSPNEIDEAFQRHYATFNHIFVMKWELFEEYMEWAFGILEAVRPKIALSEPIYAKGEVQSRAIGYLGERLFNAFLTIKEKQGADVAHVSRVFGYAGAPVKKKLNLKLAISKFFTRLFEYKKIRRGFYVKALGISITYYKPY